MSIKLTDINTKDWRELADRFEALHNDKVERVLCFPQDELIINECSTVACHGGYGLLALASPDDVDFPLSYYACGADRIAGFVGFRNHLKLLRWARDHPEYWGNGHGWKMFGSDGYLAFGKKSNEECTLLTIANHYRGVCERIEDAIICENKI